MLFRLLLVFTYSFAFAEARLPENLDLFDSLAPSCEYELALADAKLYVAKAHEKMELMEAYLGFRIGNQPAFKGFYVETKSPSKFSQVEEVNLPPILSPLWKTQIWNTGTQRLRFMDIGFENLAEESERISRRIAEHVLQFPHHSLQFNFDPSRSSKIRALYNIRWYVHEAVLEEYKERLQYLSVEELRQLITYNQDSTHNDVFALMSPTAKPIEKMSFEELSQELLMTIQISYFGTRNYLAPSLRGVMRAAGFDMFERGDRLPWEYRVPKKFLKKVRARIYKKFDPLKACEFNRYQRFGRFENPAQDYFLLNALMRAHLRGMETIFANTTNDAATKKFMQYGFKKIAETPTDQNPEGKVLDEDFEKKGMKRKNVEYLLYMATNSAEFNNFYNNLAIGSEKVNLESE